MLPALDQTRLTAPGIAGAACPERCRGAGDAGEAADAASFASLLDAHGFDASASGAAELLPLFDASTPSSSDMPGGPLDVTGAADEDTTRKADARSEDDPSRVNDAAFLVLTLAYQQPATPPVTASSGEAPASTEQVLPNDVAPPRHLRLVASNAEHLGSDRRADAADAAPVDGAQRLSEVATAATSPPTHRSIDDRVNEFLARAARPPQVQAAQKQMLEIGDAVPGEAPSAATAEPSPDAAALLARRALDAAWSAQVSQDRSATRAVLDQARPPVPGEAAASRLSSVPPAGDQTFAGFQQGRGDGGSADAGGHAGPGTPFTPARNAGLLSLHTLVPVVFEVVRDGGVPSAATTAAASALPNEDGVSTSIVQALRLQVTAGGGSATISLDPAYLGGVRVAVQVADGAVTATLHAANPQVRAWLEGNESTLRQSLLDHGLTLDRLIVTEDQGADLQRDPNPQYHTPDEQSQPRPRRRDSAERFEVVV